jgi:uncharacterized damage-inducible protein DinB
VLLELTIEQFTQQVAGSYGSICNTMVHMLSAEWDWLERCGGAARGPALNARDYPTATSLFERWGQVETAVRDFLSTLRASVVSGLDKVIESIVLARLRQWWVDLVARA